MWLEAVPGFNVEQIKQDMLKEGLLTEREWNRIESLTSRCTHIYQWMANVLADLYDKRYVRDANQLVSMTKNVDDMRGADFWGSPSLPMAYTQIITHMVKMHIFLLAFFYGCVAAPEIRRLENGQLNKSVVYIVGATHFDLLVHNYLWQGLLDLHGAVYHPNPGALLGHTPALDFILFVRDVTEHLLSENDTLPYDLDLSLGDTNENSQEDIDLGAKLVPTKVV